MYLYTVIVTEQDMRAIQYVFIYCHNQSACSLLRNSLFLQTPTDRRGVVSFVHFCFNMYFYTLVYLIVLKYRNPI